MIIVGLAIFILRKNNNNNIYENTNGIQLKIIFLITLGFAIIYGLYYITTSFHYFCCSIQWKHYKRFITVLHRLYYIKLPINAIVFGLIDKEFQNLYKMCFRRLCMCRKEEAKDYHVVRFTANIEYNDRLEIVSNENVSPLVNNERNA